MHEITKKRINSTYFLVFEVSEQVNEITIMFYKIIKNKRPELPYDVLSIIKKFQTKSEAQSHLNAFNVFQIYSLF